MQVFIGMESLREDNLKAADKRQNKVGEYRESIARWHEAGILCHVGFIIGFPHDTYARIMEDVRTLADDLLVDQASFFMLTPLPGSRDHRAAVDAGVPMDPDYNNFDSFHATTPHPRMSADEWTAAYRDAWKAFYSFDHMRRALLRQNPHTYWGMFKCFLWYRASMIEGTHPMVTGLFRLKDRLSRRTGIRVESRLQFLRRRLFETARTTLDYAKLALEMQELWLATRIRREEYGFVGDLRALKKDAAAWLDLKTNWSRLHAAMAVRLRDVRTPAGVSAAGTSATMLERVEALRQSMRSRAEEPAASVKSFQAPSLETRRALSQYWGSTARHLQRWRVWHINPFTLAWNAASDLKNVIVFLNAMRSERF